VGFRNSFHYCQLVLYIWRLSLIFFRKTNKIYLLLLQLYIKKNMCHYNRTLPLPFLSHLITNEIQRPSPVTWLSFLYTFLVWHWQRERGKNLICISWLFRLITCCIPGKTEFINYHKHIIKGTGIGLLTWRRTTGWMDGFRFLAAARFGPGGPPSHLFNEAIGSYYPAGKANRVWNWPLTSTWCRDQEDEAKISLPHTSLWRTA
jgi:hypothetical protein